MINSILTSSKSKWKFERRSAVGVVTQSHLIDFNFVSWPNCKIKVWLLSGSYSQCCRLYYHAWPRRYHLYNSDVWKNKVMAVFLLIKKWSTEWWVFFYVINISDYLTSIFYLCVNKIHLWNTWYNVSICYYVGSKYRNVVLLIANCCIYMYIAILVSKITIRFFSQIARTS